MSQAPPHRVLSLAAGVMPEFTPQQTAAAAAAAGFDATGVWVDLETWTPVTTREVRTALTDGGLPALDVEVIWIEEGPDRPDHFRVIDIGAELGAANVLVVSSDPDAGAAADKFGRLVDHATASGLRASLEFGVFTRVRTLSDALEMIERCGRPEAGLLIDPLHLHRSGGSPEQLATIPRHRLAYAQICDAPAEKPDFSDRQAVIDDAVDFRRLLGEGDLPLEAFVAALPPGLPLSVELRSKALRDAYPDPVARARALAANTRAWLDRLQEGEG